jgi:hypothetical protein
VYLIPLVSTFKPYRFCIVLNTSPIYVKPFSLEDKIPLEPIIVSAELSYSQLKVKSLDTVNDPYSVVEFALNVLPIRISIV